ncbi:M66 family metalloprotease [Providencia huaxiensis]
MPITEPTTSAPLENLAYSENTWSAIIPKEYIKPGIRFEFNTLESTGALNDVKIGAPNILMINTIDIGMLTPQGMSLTFKITMS